MTAITPRGKKTEEAVLRSYERSCDNDEGFKIFVEIMGKKYGKSRRNYDRLTNELVKNGELIDFQPGVKGPIKHTYCPKHIIDNAIQNGEPKKETNIDSTTVDNSFQNSEPKVEISTTQINLENELSLTDFDFSVHQNSYELFKKKIAKMVASPTMCNYAYLVEEAIRLGNSGLALIEDDKTWTSRRRIDRVCKENIYPFLSICKSLRSGGVELPVISAYFTKQSSLSTITRKGKTYDVRGSIAVKMSKEDENGVATPIYPTILEWKFYLVETLVALERLLAYYKEQCNARERQHYSFQQELINDKDRQT
jgi:hypothetical protein